MLGVKFEVIPSPCTDESYPPELEPERIAEYIALKKNAACAFGADAVVITADTVVRCGSSILGKPGDAAEARTMLRLLSGRSHFVETGVAVSSGGVVRSLTAVTAVEFGELTDNDIDWYVQRYRPFDKAGAYGIQEWIGAIGVKGIEGSYYNVMGLPLRLLFGLLREV